MSFSISNAPQEGRTKKYYTWWISNQRPGKNSCMKNSLSISEIWCQSFIPIGSGRYNKKVGKISFRFIHVCWVWPFYTKSRQKGKQWTVKNRFLTLILWFLTIHFKTKMCWWNFQNWLNYWNMVVHWLHKVGRDFD